MARRTERLIAPLLLVVVGVVGVAGEPPRVFVRAPDDDTRGLLALALIDEGMIVSTDPDDATHDVTIARDGDGFVVTCAGASAKGTNVAAGPPALIVLELEHRVASLVRQTAAKDAGPARARVAVQLVDKAGGKLPEGIAAALLEAGVSLAPQEAAAARLCVDANADTVTVNWGASPERCDGRPVGLERRDLVARVLVGEALRLRDAAPPPADHPRPEIVVPLAKKPAPPPALASSPSPSPSSPSPAASASAPASSATQTSAPAASTATPAATATPTATPAVAATAAAPVPATKLPISIATRGGFILRGGVFDSAAADLLLEAQASFPVWNGVEVVVVVDGSGATDPLLVAESLVGGGVAYAVDANEWLRLSAGVVVGAWVHGWRFDETDAGIALDPALAFPLTADFRVAQGIDVGVAVEAGALKRDRIHTIEGEEVWARSAVFGVLSAGITFDIL